jgi:hypothetical protein|nr:MAG TPA: hypothetical protein [Caudoviricetes sp.]
MVIHRKRSTKAIKADDELDVEDELPEVEDTDVEVSPEATELLFETEDVAQLLAEVTQQPVDVDTTDDGESVEFTVGKDVYTVESEGDEEVLESVRKPFKRKKAIKSSRQMSKNIKKPVRQIRRK